MKMGNQLVTDLHVRPTDTHHYLHASLCHDSHYKNQYLSAKTCYLTEFVLKTPFLIKGVMN